MNLAETLGMPLSEVLSMPMTEFAEWLAYFKIKKELDEKASKRS